MEQKVQQMNAWPAYPLNRGHFFHWHYFNNLTTQECKCVIK